MNFFQFTVLPSWWSQAVPLLYGYEECAAGHSFGPCVRHYYLLHYVLEGAGVLYKNRAAYSVHAGDIFVICPEEVTTYQASKQLPWTYVWLGFEAADAPEFLKEPVLRQPPVRQLFERIRDLEHSRDNIFSLTYDILRRLSAMQEPNAAKPSKYAAYAKAYMDLSYMEPIRIQNIARDLHIDRRYLTALFREAYGVTPQAYLMELRLERSRLFLSQGHSVAEAAAMAGFADLANFSRHYKSHYGTSPSRTTSG